MPRGSKEFAIALGRQGSSTDTVVASTVPTILVDQSGKEPSILIDSKDVKFYLQARDMKRSGDQSIKGRLMNRQRKGSSAPRPGTSTSTARSRSTTRCTSTW